MSTSLQYVAAQPDVLHSWKDISLYVGRSVRTIQRWERDFGFPVHRASGELKGSVLAFRPEVDEWLHARRRRKRKGATALRQGFHTSFERLSVNHKLFEQRVQDFQEGTRKLSEALAKTTALRSRFSRR